MRAHVSLFRILLRAYWDDIALAGVSVKLGLARDVTESIKTLGVLHDVSSTVGVASYVSNDPSLARG